MKAPSLQKTVLGVVAMIRFVGVVFFCLLVLSGGMVGLALYDKRDKYGVVEDDILIPDFSVQYLNFVHKFKRRQGVPYAAAAVIDIDNDGRDEIFIGGGLRQQDALFRYDGREFSNIGDLCGLVKQGGGQTTGAAALDLDGNGYTDLIVSRERSLSIFLNDAGKFSAVDPEIEFADGEIPLGPVPVDLNHDNCVDIFIPVVERGSRANWYQLKETAAGTLSRFYINNGDGTFHDFTSSVGLDYPGGTLQAFFADADGDGREDLTCLTTDGLLTVWRNLGNLLFQKSFDSKSFSPGDFMGMAARDIDNDGRRDILLTGRGSTIPGFLAKITSRYRPQRIPGWLLLMGLKDFTFSDMTEKVHLAGFEMARGAVFVDCNGDGFEDLFVSQNHPYWPMHWFSFLRLPGKVLLQRPGGIFRELPEKTKDVFENRSFGITPLVADVNGDGRPDIVQVNLDGKSSVWVNRTRYNGFLKVVLPEKIHSLGAVVSVRTLSGKTIERTFVAAEELCSDSSHAFFIGLGVEKAIEVTVHYHDGYLDQASGMLNDTTVRFE